MCRFLHRIDQAGAAELLGQDAGITDVRGNVIARRLKAETIALFQRMRHKAVRLVRDRVSDAILRRSPPSGAGRLGRRVEALEDFDERLQRGSSCCAQSVPWSVAEVCSVQMPPVCRR